MIIKIVKDKISIDELQDLAQASFGDMVKVVADVGRKIMAVGGELHSDAEALLLENGSQQDDLWGANIYPDRPAGQRIEYQSLINVRPRLNNRSMEIEDLEIRTKTEETIKKLCPEI